MKKSDLLCIPPYFELVYSLLELVLTDWTVFGRNQCLYLFQTERKWKFKYLHNCEQIHTVQSCT